jgi:hypothetical protein
MLLNSQEWVMRRVERVQFCDDQAATRRVSIDLYMPTTAPRYCIEGESAICLVPLTIMRRKTLVNFDAADDGGNTLPLMSMRHNQTLTEQIILALAESTPDVCCSPAVQEFAHVIAFGTQDQIQQAFQASGPKEGGRQ